MFPESRAALLPALAIAGLALTAAHAWAQPVVPAAPTPPTARPDPADPKAQVPAALYLSPLRAYQGFAEPQVAPWRETNERVRQRGGWRVYAREAREPDSTRPPAAAPAASQPPPATQPAEGGHSAHPMK